MCGNRNIKDMDMDMGHVTKRFWPLPPKEYVPFLMSWKKWIIFNPLPPVCSNVTFWAIFFLKASLNIFYTKPWGVISLLFLDNDAPEVVVVDRIKMETAKLRRIWRYFSDISIFLYWIWITKLIRTRIAAVWSFFWMNDN